MTLDLRLDSFDLHCYALPYARSIQWFDSVETEGTYVLLRLRSQSGEIGLAEAPIRPSWSGVSLRSLIAALEDMLLPALRGLNLSDSMAVRRALDRYPENTLAKMLVDNACWHLSACAAQQALWQVWGGQQRIALSWCVTRRSPELMAAEAANMVERYGFRTLKIKGGQGYGEDKRALRDIRKAVGDAVTLSVDANGAYPMRNAASYMEQLAKYGVTLVEDPCPLAPDEAFATLNATATLPILVDTACASHRDAHDFLRQGARILSIKAGRVGFTEARRIQALAETRGAAVVAGLYAESDLGTLANLPFAATLNAPATSAELSFFLLLKTGILHQPLEVSDGYLTLPDTPDLNELVNWDRVRYCSVLRQ